MAGRPRGRNGIALFRNSVSFGNHAVASCYCNSGVSCFFRSVTRRKQGVHAKIGECHSMFL